MKNLTEKIILLTFAILLIAGCKKHITSSEDQDILFQFEYINYAWGYQHNGFIIDSKGNVLTYSNPDKWNFPDRDLLLSKSQVIENLNNCELSNKKISTVEVRKYSNYIQNFASSKVSALKNVAADAGSYEYKCYQFSESSGTYKVTLIKMEGDFTCENLNFYSKKVVAWMKEISDNLTLN